MSWIIALWVSVSLVGLTLSIYLTWDSFQDLRALGSTGNGRRIAGRSRVIREGVRITVHLTYLLIAVPLIGREDIRLSIALLGLLYGNIALVFNSLVDARARALMYPKRPK